MTRRKPKQDNSPGARAARAACGRIREKFKGLADVQVHGDKLKIIPRPGNERIVPAFIAALEKGTKN
jgi:hypothetical protein